MIDHYALPVTAGSRAALEAYDRAVHGLLGWDGQALTLFRAAPEADPGLALAHAGAGVCLFLEERFEEARAAIETARSAVVGQTARERGHVEALALLVTGKPADAERAMPPPTDEEVGLVLYEKETEAALGLPPAFIPMLSSPSVTRWGGSARSGAGRWPTSCTRTGGASPTAATPSDR